MTDYPEHEKVAVIVKESQAIGEFLDWIIGEGYTIERNGISISHFDELLAEFFNIDLKKLEKEKRKMLYSIRAGQPMSFVDTMLLNEVRASVSLDNDEIGTFSVDEMPSHGDKGE